MSDTVEKVTVMRIELTIGVPVLATGGKPASEAIEQVRALVADLERTASDHAAFLVAKEVMFA